MKTGITVLSIAHSAAAANGLITFMQLRLPAAKCWREDLVPDDRVHPWADQPAGHVRVIAEVPMRKSRDSSGFSETKHPLGRMVNEFYEQLGEPHQKVNGFAV